MAVSRRMQSDDNKYGTGELDRPTTAPLHEATTTMKYIGPRIIGLNHSNSYHGSMRNFALSTAGSTFKSAPISTDHGFAALVHSPSSLSAVQTIDGDRTINEQRELSKISETLTESILQCCNLDAHNRALELQIEWLENNVHKNSSIIDQMFRQEIQTARQLIADALRGKPDLEKKLRDIHQTTLANDQHYQQLLSKRNNTNKDIFNYQRQSAQTRAELEFLRARVGQFSDEIQFYTTKNDSLQVRQVKLRYELDEELFARQVLRMEVEVLENEKITNEDVRTTSIDDSRRTINITQITAIQSSTYYREQLTHQIRRFKLEYEKKVQTYRDELHRKFELELHRYQMLTVCPVPNVTREHEQKLDQLKRERKTTEQQISSVRDSISKIQIQIDVFGKQIHQNKIETIPTSDARRHLIMLEQMIREREKQLHDAMLIRTELKKRIEKYSEEVMQYLKPSTQSFYEIQQSSGSTARKSILRSSSAHEIKMGNYFEDSLSPNIIPLKSPSLQEINHKNSTSLEEGTLVRFNEFDVEQDCRELNKIFSQGHVDEAAVIRILCNRSVTQRLQIRDAYKNLFYKNMGNIIETEITGDSKTILRILILSPIERDCYELRRVLTGMNTDGNILIEIFLGNSNKQIKSIISLYFKLFNSSLDRDILGDRETPSKRIFLALLRANRPEDEAFDEDEVVDDARNLSESISKWRTDGSTFIRLLCDRSNAHLRQTFDAYPQFAKADIEQSIRIDTDPDLSRTLMAIVRIIRNRPRFFAYELRKSLKGSSTNEDNLTRIIVSRCEIDMVQIKSEYKKITRRTLFDHIQTDTKGNYKRALLELLRQRIEPISKEFSLKPSFPLPQKSRSTVQWNKPLRQQAFQRSLNTSDFHDVKQFDRNNQAKGTTLSTIHPRPQSSEQHIVNKLSYLSENEEQQYN